MKKLSPVLLALASAGLLCTSFSAHAVDEKAASELARKNNCMKCHSLTRDKQGPSFKKVAEKYKGKADAEAQITKNVTQPHKVKFNDGTEDDHQLIESTKDAGEIKNLVQWVLSR